MATGYTLAQVRDTIVSDAALHALAEDGADNAIADALNTTSTTREAVVPMTVPRLFSLLSEESLARLSVHPSASAIRTDVTRQDREAVEHWATLLAAKPDPNSTGTITSAERDAIIASLQEIGNVPSTPIEALAGAAGATVT